MFERIKLFYSKGLWSAAMVQQAVSKGILTEEQYLEIAGPQMEADGQEVAADG